MLPGHLVRDVNSVPAERHHRHDVGAQRVADHHEVRCVDAAALKDPAVCFDVLLAEDLHAQEQLTQARPSELALLVEEVDRKSTRLNSSHRCISYAVFCLKK